MNVKFILHILFVQKDKWQKTEFKQTHEAFSDLNF